MSSCEARNLETEEIQNGVRPTQQEFPRNFRLELRRDPSAPRASIQCPGKRLSLFPPAEIDYVGDGLRQNL